jgi:hypothetical protein
VDDAVGVGDSPVDGDSEGLGLSDGDGVPQSGVGDAVGTNGGTRMVSGVGDGLADGFGSPHAGGDGGAGVGGGGVATVEGGAAPWGTRTASPG